MASTNLLAPSAIHFHFTFLPLLPKVFLVSIALFLKEGHKRSLPAFFSSLFLFWFISIPNLSSSRRIEYVSIMLLNIVCLQPIPLQKKKYLDN
ncbi:hypothetical protein AB4K20DRAFT_1281024 [Rhizopus microsporus]